MKYIESPCTYQPQPHDRSLYLAGGITGCPNWQQEMVHLLAGRELTLLNPRQKHFPMDDPTAADTQIRWEAYHLHVAGEILFWFPCETLCPIALYELGAWSMTEKPLYIGVHPAYQRRRDIEIQTQLARPDITIVYSLHALIKQIPEVRGRSDLA